MFDRLILNIFFFFFLREPLDRPSWISGTPATRELSLTPILPS
jgi:hypothetical protein